MKSTVLCRYRGVPHEPGPVPVRAAVRRQQRLSQQRILLPGEGLRLPGAKPGTQLRK